MALSQFAIATGIAGAGVAAAGMNIMSPFMNTRGANRSSQQENAAIEAIMGADLIFGTAGALGTATGITLGGMIGGSRQTAQVFRKMRSKSVSNAARAGIGSLPSSQVARSSVARLRSKIRTGNIVTGGIIGGGIGLALASEAKMSMTTPLLGLQHNYLDASGNSDVQGAVNRKVGGFSSLIKGAVGGGAAYYGLGVAGRAVERGFSGAGKMIGGLMKNPIVRGIAGIGLAASMSGMMSNTAPSNNRIQGMGY